MSIRSYLSLFLIVLFSSACDSKKIGELRSENDSLLQEIEYRNNILIAMNEVNDIADSILNMHGEGMNDHQYQRYLERIQYLHGVLMVSKQKLGYLNEELGKSKEEAGAYNLMVMALQDEVSLRDDEISGQQKEIHGAKRAYQKNISELEKAVAQKDKELMLLQSAIEEIKRLNAAESFFVKAQRIEEKARKIIFAPRKKKESYREALELYQRSYLLGKVEAGARIQALKKLI